MARMGTNRYELGLQEGTEGTGRAGARGYWLRVIGYWGSARVPAAALLVGGVPSPRSSKLNS